MPFDDAKAPVNGGWRTADPRRGRARVVSTAQMSAEEEVALARRFRAEGDPSVLHRFVFSHLLLARKHVAKLSRYGSSKDDLLQAACIGLMEAARRFDPELGVRFSTFASFWLRASLTAAVQQERGGVTMRFGATEQKTALFRFSAERAAWERKQGRELDDAGRAELAQRFRISKADLARVEAWHAGATVSLDVAPLDGGASFVERIRDDAPSPEERLVESDARGKLMDLLEVGLSALDARSRHIVEARHLTEPPRTLDDLGVEYGVSKERIRQIEEKALLRLHKVLAREGRAVRTIFAALSAADSA